MERKLNELETRVLFDRFAYFELKFGKFIFIKRRKTFKCSFQIETIYDDKRIFREFEIDKKRKINQLDLP